MKAMEYWRCAEIGLAMPTEEDSKHPRAKFVIGESLPGQGNLLTSTQGLNESHVDFYTNFWQLAMLHFNTNPNKIGSVYKVMSNLSTLKTMKIRGFDIL